MTDLHWLSAVVLLTLLAAFPYVVQRTLALGPARAFGNPSADDDLAMAPWAQRSKRAHMNAVENLALFAPALLAAHALGVSPTALAGAGSVYFAARATHYVVYLLGVPVLRTLAHLVGLGATVWMVVQVLFR
jgi:uncharacterized MAPEG superfamily protein